MVGVAAATTTATLRDIYYVDIYFPSTLTYCHRTLIRLSYHPIHNRSFSSPSPSKFFFCMLSTFPSRFFSSLPFFLITQSENLIYLKKYLLNDFNGFSMNRVQSEASMRHCVRKNLIWEFDYILY